MYSPMNAADGIAKRPRHPLVGITATRFGPMLYPRKDHFIGTSLRLYGEYCRLEIEVYRRIVRPGDTVVDAGANIGAHTLLFSGCAGPAGQVLAFEPQHRLWRLLLMNLMLNRAGNVRALPVALADRDGTVEFPQPGLHHAFNYGSIGLDTDQPVRRAAVPLRRLDSFSLARCDFLKIDTEGAEGAVIEGAVSTIERCRPVISAEAEISHARARGERQAAAIAAWLGPLLARGYRCWRMVPRLFTRGNFKNNPVDAFGGVVNAGILAFPGEAPDWLAMPQFGLFPVASVDDILDNRRGGRSIRQRWHEAPG